jgi:2-oxoglutarate dehydrogenase complex dehydrogenase (E1) component-like enzyme
VLLCSGQIYYHLSQARRARKIDDIVLVRLEQIAPFPHDIILRVMRQYADAELCWVQEEPKNQGAWGYVRCAATGPFCLHDCGVRFGFVRLRLHNFIVGLLVCALA